MLRLENAVKRFGNQRALDGVSISINPNEVLVLIGPSGSGKSTLLRSINLLEIPDTGSLHIEDTSIEFDPQYLPPRSSIEKIRSFSSMIFQNFQLFPHLNAIDNVALSLKVVKKLSHAVAHELAMAQLKRVGLEHKTRALPTQLSGGQQQRVAIARALAVDPHILLCDEPTSALDPELAKEVTDTLTKVASDGTTMLVATHDMRLAQSLGQQVYFMDQGKIVESGTAHSLFEHAKSERLKGFLDAVLS